MNKLTKSDINLIAKFIPKKSIILILEYVYFTGKELIATDLENTVLIPFICEKPCLVPFEPLKNACFEQFNSLSFTDTHVIVNGVVNIPIRTKDMDEFPTIPECITYNGIFTMTDEIKSLRPFLCTDELRPIMNGVAFEEGLLVATNAHLLKFIATNSPVSKDFVAPGSLLDLPNGVYNIHFDEEKKYAKFRNGYNEYYLRLLEGNYPNWRGVVPTESMITVTYLREELLQKATQADKLSNATDKLIILNWKNSTLSSQNYDQDTSLIFNINTIGIDGNVSWEEIGLNAKFLATVIKSIPKTKKFVKLKMSEPLKAIVINEHIVLMPVLITKDE